VRFKTADDFAITLEEGRAYRSDNTALASSVRERNTTVVNSEHAAEPVAAAVHDGNAVGH
jgi:hypothetical protein